MAALKHLGARGAGFVLGWVIVGTVLLVRIWPLPPDQACARLAAAEVRRGGKLPQLEPDERQMVTKVLLDRLTAIETAATASVSAG